MWQTKISSALCCAWQQRSWWWRVFTGSACAQDSSRDWHERGGDSQPKRSYCPFLLSSAEPGPCPRGKTKPWHQTEITGITSLSDPKQQDPCPAVPQVPAQSQTWPSPPFHFVVTAVELLPPSQMPWGLAHWFVSERGQSRHHSKCKAVSGRHR